MKAKLIFGIITALLYPLLIYVIMPYYIHHLHIEGTDAAGAGMEKAFTFIYGCIFWTVLLFIVSMIVAHKAFHSWETGIIAMATGIFLSWAAYQVDEAFQTYQDRDYTEYYDTGELMEKGKQDSSGRYGKITKYRRDGSIESIENYKNGKVNGQCELFYPDGLQKAKGVKKTTTKEVLDGKWIYLNTDGTLNDERTYRMGELMKSKNYTLYYDSTSCDSVIVIRAIADHRLYSGILNKVAVVSESLFPNLVTTIVINGKCEGKYEELYNFNGKTQVAATATFKNNQLNGALLKYHENGQLQQASTYSNGQLQGECTLYYADSVATRPFGQVKYHCNYKDGKREGMAQWFYPSGKIDTKCNYKDGKPIGIEYSYREDGIVWNTYNHDQEKKEE